MKESRAEHLSQEEFEMLASNSAQPRDNQIAAHLESCNQCREKAKAYEAAAMKLNRLKPLSRPGSSGCPRVEEWPAVASGTLSPEKANEYLLHAAQCDTCGPLVRTTRAFDDEFTTEEELAIARLTTPASERTRMAAMLGAKSQAGAKPSRAGVHLWKLFRTSPAFAYGLAAAILVVSVGAVLFFSLRTESADKLLAKAYSEQRTLEPRFAGAEYGPVRVMRGSGQSSVNKPQALLDAESLIHRHLQKEPNNIRWLDAQGKADLLEANYDAAIQTFRRALDVDPGSESLLVDAASAYFERAELADQPGDYIQAIDLLGRVLNRHPGNPVALFNRALANEKMFFYHQALDDWDRYLQIDPESRWADEARQRRVGVQKKLDQQKQSYNTPLLAPADFAETIKSGNAQAIKRVDQRIEDYLEIALREWLPRALLEKDQGGPAKTALNALAGILARQHDDRWLLDFIRFPLPDAAALHLLISAIKANNDADFVTARDASGKAAILFRRSGNRPGELRAWFETAYALQLSNFKAVECVSEANLAIAQVEKHDYSWLRGHLQLEKWNCEQQLANFTQDQRELDHALNIAGKSGYASVKLRALVMMAGNQHALGNLLAAYAFNREGLASYWSGTHPPYRAYQFYSEIALTSEEAGAWNVALLSAREAVSASQLAGQRLREATARYRLGRYALMTGNVTLAESESSQANLLFASLPHNEVNQSYQADQEVRLAGLAAQRGEAGLAWAHLSRAQPQLPEAKNYFISLRFWSAFSELQLLRGDAAAAEKALYSAVAAAEWGLRSIKNERERAQWAQETGNVYRRLTQQRWESQDAEGALRIWEWYRGASVRKSPDAAPGNEHSLPAFANSKSLPSLPSMVEISQASHSFVTETVVSYMQLPAGLIVWTIDDHGVTARWVKATPQQLAQLVRRFHEECSNPDSDLGLVRSDARALYDLLIAPIAGLLAAQRTLVFELDDSLAQIPVAALMDPAGHFLAESYSIVISPGIYPRSLLHSGEPFSRRQRALFVGAPALMGDLATRLQPLEDASAEARDIASKFDAAVLLSGSNASAAKVEKELTHAAIFHFAGHALSIKETPVLLLASAETSEPAVLWDAETVPIERFHDLQLVVLSACSTARGQQNIGSPESLVRFFLRARVPHVIAARWNVDSIITAEFMRAFYDALLRGDSITASMQDARNGLRSRMSTTHPYYWAAFEVFGR